MRRSAKGLSKTFDTSVVARLQIYDITGVDAWQPDSIKSLKIWWSTACSTTFSMTLLTEILSLNRTLCFSQTNIFSRVSNILANYL